mgnify:CR=1 FL=1
MTFNPKTQQWEWDPVDDVRDVPNLAPAGDWTSQNDAFNEFSMISPDGTDKVVYGMVRSSGVVYVTYDRGRNWQLFANEPGSAQQPQFAFIDTNRAFVTWADESNPRNTLGKVFYFDAIGACIGIARLCMLCGVKCNIAIDLRDKNLEESIKKTGYRIVTERGDIIKE